MSTKIYNGYRLDLTLAQLEKKMKSFRVELADLAESLFQKLVMGIAVEMLDTIALKRRIDWYYAQYTTLDEFSAMGLTYLSAHERSRKAAESKLRDPDFDFSCEVVVLPHNKQLYALLFAENKELKSFWEYQSWVHPFYYWNNAEQPEDMTARVWRARGRLWDKILWNRGIPSLSGLTFTCYTTPASYWEVITKGNRVANIPPFKKRCVYMSELLIMDAFMMGKNPDRFYSDKEIKQWMAEHPRRVNAIREKVKRTLKRQITKKDLLKKYKSTWLETNPEETIIPCRGSVD